MAKGREIRESRKTTVLGTTAGLLMKLVCGTLRFEFEDRCGLGEQGKFPDPVVYCLWHNRIFVVPAAWRKLCGDWRKAVVLTSASHDGAMVARAMGVFGLGSVRGSSSRRGVAALVALRKALRQGSDICLTPDGPRGPRYVVQAGAVKLAEAGGAMMIPIHVEFSSVWCLKTWDRFHVPKPFTKVRVIFDEALAVPSGLSEDEFEARRAQLEAVLRAGVEDISEEP